MLRDMESGVVFKMLMQPGNMFLLKLGQNYQAHVEKRRSKNIQKYVIRDRKIHGPLFFGL